MQRNTIRVLSARIIVQKRGLDNTGRISCVRNSVIISKPDAIAESIGGEALLARSRSYMYDTIRHSIWLLRYLGLYLPS